MLPPPPHAAANKPAAANAASSPKFLGVARVVTVIPASNSAWVVPFPRHAAGAGTVQPDPASSTAI
ncbi:hypothetical protein GCM10027360_02220 [Amycolatopsis echigonensis]